MGCWCSKEKEKDKMESTSSKKLYSWDIKEKVDTSKYILDGLQKESVVKLDGSIDGQQFIIQNCNNSTIYLLDYMDTVTIDNCSNCKLVIGPVQGSIFLRNCEECLCVVSCQQFRTRDCDDIEIYLLCTTQPVIESSQNMKFFPLQLSYSKLLHHCQLANISIFNNHWDQIHDFTPSEDTSNWILTPHQQCPSEAFVMTSSGDGDDVERHAKTNDLLQSVDFSLERSKSLVPVTRGDKARSDIACFVVFFEYENLSSQMILEVLHKITEKLDLIKTCRTQLSNDEATRMFIDESADNLKYRKAAVKGLVVGAEICGRNAVEFCKKIVEEFVQSTDSQALIYCSPNEEDTSHILDVFNSICNKRFTF